MQALYFENWCVPIIRRATAVFDSSYANAVREAQRAQEAAMTQVAAEEAQYRAWQLHHQAFQQEASIAAATAAEEVAAVAAASEKAIPDDATRYSATRSARKNRL